MKHVKRFLKYWIVGTICSFVPLAYFGAMFGAPSVLLASAILTVMDYAEDINKELRDKAKES